MKASKWSYFQALTLALATLVLGLKAQETETDLNTETRPLINIYPDECGVAVFAPDFLMRNVDDDQQFEEVGYELWDIAHNPSLAEDDLKIVAIQATAGKIDATVTLDIIAGQEKINGIFWSDPLKNAQFGNLSWSVPAETSIQVLLYVEGYDPSDSVNDVQFRATISSPGGTGSDGKEYHPCNSTAVDTTTVYEVDMDVDTKNNNGFVASGYDDAEDQIEASEDPQKPGKVVLQNDSDIDRDGVHDAIDSIGLQNQGETEFVEGLKFVPVEIKLSDAYDPETAVVEFSYNTNIPRAGEGISRDCVRGFATDTFKYPQSR